MDKYFKRIITRTEAAKEASINSALSDEEVETVNSALKKQTILHYSMRICLLPMFFWLYKKGFFEQKSRLFAREIGLVLGGLFYFSASDYISNEVMWRECGEIVKRYSNYSEQYYIDSASLEKMKSMYAARENAAKNRLSADATENETNELMYSDSDSLEQDKLVSKNNA